MCVCTNMDGYEQNQWLQLSLRLTRRSEEVATNIQKGCCIEHSNRLSPSHSHEEHMRKNANI